MTHFPKNLTENATTEGKGKEATADDLITLELKRMVDAHYETCRFAPYLTKSECWEYFALSGSRRGLTVEERCQRDWRLEELDQKIDRDELVRQLHIHDLKMKLAAKESKKQTHAGYELGPREFTLTYSPDWFDDEKAQFFMKQAIERLCSYYSSDILYLRAVGEKTKAGRVHIHVYYELEKGLKITDKNLKRAYSKWDSKHHHHKLVKNTANFLGYIDKDSSNAWYLKVVDNRSTQVGRVIF